MVIACVVLLPSTVLLLWSQLSAAATINCLSFFGVISGGVYDLVTVGSCLASICSAADVRNCRSCVYDIQYP